MVDSVQADLEAMQEAVLTAAKKFNAANHLLTHAADAGAKGERKGGRRRAHASLTTLASTKGKVKGSYIFRLDEFAILLRSPKYMEPLRLAALHDELSTLLEEEEDTDDVGTEDDSDTDTTPADDDGRLTMEAAMKAAAARERRREVRAEARAMKKKRHELRMRRVAELQALMWDTDPASLSDDSFFSKHKLKAGRSPSPDSAHHEAKRKKKKSVHHRLSFGAEAARLPGMHQEIADELTDAGLVVTSQRVQSQDYRKHHFETLLLVSATHNRLVAEKGIAEVETWLDGGGQAQPPTVQHTSGHRAKQTAKDGTASKEKANKEGGGKEKEEKEEPFSPVPAFSAADRIRLLYRAINNIEMSTWTMELRPEKRDDPLVRDVHERLLAHDGKHGRLPPVDMANYEVRNDSTVRLLTHPFVVNAFPLHDLGQNEVIALNPVKFNVHMDHSLKQYSDEKRHATATAVQARWRGKMARRRFSVVGDAGGAGADGADGAGADGAGDTGDKPGAGTMGQKHGSMLEMGGRQVLKFVKGSLQRVRGAHLKDKALSGLRGVRQRATVLGGKLHALEQRAASAATSAAHQAASAATSAAHKVEHRLHQGAHAVKEGAQHLGSSVIEFKHGVMNQKDEKRKRQAFSKHGRFASTMVSDGVHDLIAMKNKSASWLWKKVFISDIQLDVIRSHFGDEVGFYYAFVAMYDQFLFVLAPVGIVVTAITAVVDDGTEEGTRANQKVLVVWALVLSLWGILFLIFWKRRCSELVERWSLGGVANVQSLRKEYLAIKTAEEEAKKRRHEQQAKEKAKEASRKLRKGSSDSGGSSGSSGRRHALSALSRRASIRGGTFQSKSMQRAAAADSALRRLQHLFTDGEAVANVGSHLHTLEKFLGLDRLRRHKKKIKRGLIALSLVPFMGVIWVVFVAGVTALFVFELWLIFEWGDCAAKNDEYEALGRPADMDLCMGPEDTRGFAGWLAGIVPGLLEALAFAALLPLFRKVARTVTNWQNWDTEQKYERAFVVKVVAMEFLGMFAWFFMLAFVFVPEFVDEEEDCAEHGGAAAAAASNGTSAAGPEGGEPRPSVFQVLFTMEGIFGCDKEDIAPLPLRLSMMKAYMITPFLVNQLLNILFKTFLPMWVHSRTLRAAKRRARGNADERRSCSDAVLAFFSCVFGYNAALRWKPAAETMGTRQAMYTAKCGRRRAIHDGNAPKKLAAVLAFKSEGKKHQQRKRAEEAARAEAAAQEEHKRNATEVLKRSMSVMSFEGAALMARFAKTHDDSTDTTRRELLGRLDARRVDEILQEASKADFDLSEEFVEMSLQFAFIAFFSLVFPLGPLCAAINNIFELRVDLIKMTNVERRAVPLQRAGIGAWDEVLHMVVNMGALVTCSLLVVTLQALGLLLPGRYEGMPFHTYAAEALLFALLWWQVYRGALYVLQHAVSSKSAAAKRIALERKRVFRNAYVEASRKQKEHKRQARAAAWRQSHESRKKKEREARMGLRRRHSVAEMADQRRSMRNATNAHLERQNSIASIVARVKLKDKARRLSLGARDRLQHQAMRTASAMHEAAQKAKTKVAGGPKAGDGGADDDEDGPKAGDGGALHILHGATIFSGLDINDEEEAAKDSDEDEADERRRKESLTISGQTVVDEVHDARTVRKTGGRRG